MLVLSRKKKEEVVIAGHIRVSIVDITGNKVRLGVEAPKDVSVHRGEVQEKVNSESGVSEE